MGSEEFLNRMVEALGIIVDKRPTGRLHIKCEDPKNFNYTTEVNDR